MTLVVTWELPFKGPNFANPKSESLALKAWKVKEKTEQSSQYGYLNGASFSEKCKDTKNLTPSNNMLDVLKSR